MQKCMLALGNLFQVVGRIAEGWGFNICQEVRNGSKKGVQRYTRSQLSERETLNREP